jgi:hypothetical protein
MKTIIIVIESGKANHTGLLSWIGPSRKTFRNEGANEVLKVYDKIKYPDLMAVRKQIKKWGGTSTMVDNKKFI